MRNRKIISVTWIDENHFTCVYEFNGRMVEGKKEAGYGWSKGGSFFLYRIGNGHIEKLGTYKRSIVEVDFPPPVW